MITLGTWQKLRPGRLLLSLEQPRMRQNEGIACYCMTVFTPRRWRRLFFSDFISGGECSLISKCRWYPFFPREYSKLLIFEYYISDILVSDWLNADQCISTCANRSAMKLKRIGHRSHKLNCRLKDVDVSGCLFKQWCSTLPIERGEIVSYRDSGKPDMHVSLNVFPFFLFKWKKGEESRVSCLWKMCSYKTCALSGGKRVLSNITLAWWPIKWKYFLLFSFYILYS